MMTPAMMAAFMSAAAFCVAVRMLMVGACHIRLIIKCTIQQSRYRCICVSGHTAIQTDTGLRQSSFGTGADAAADQRINTVAQQESGQSTMPAPRDRHCFSRNDRSVRNSIKAKGLRMSKVLEHLSVFIGNCNFHINQPFGRDASAQIGMKECRQTTAFLVK